MLPTAQRCIYCRGLFLPIGEGDHVLPQALGKFRGDKRFRGVCPTCNNACSPSEQQLIRCGPESLYLRRMAPATPGGSRAKRKRYGESVGAVGADPPDLRVAHPDHFERVRITPTDIGGSYFDHLVCEYADGSDESIELHPCMSAARLRDQLWQLRKEWPKKAWFHCHEDHAERYREILNEIFPGHEYREGPSTEPGIHRLRCRVRVEVGLPYFRAIAKIGFHYYLTRNARGARGDEHEFTGVRSFIRHGVGSLSAFVRPGGDRFPAVFTRSSRMGLGHVLIADESEDLVVVRVHLFAGPNGNEFKHDVILGPISTPIVMRSLVVGHGYSYDDPQPERGFAGEVTELPLRRTGPVLI